jgi:hypothetical protein
MLENLRESAWWTKRLAGDMAKVTGLFAAALNVVAVLALLLTVTSVVEPSAISTSSNWISAAILFVIAQGPHHAHARYAQLRDRARSVEDATDHLLASANPSEAEAMLVAADYHLARQGAPVIPTLWYEYRRPELNRLWDSVQAQCAITAGKGG